MSDWTLVREALEQSPCAVTWCMPDTPCSRCAGLAALGRLEPLCREVIDAWDALRLELTAETDARWMAALRAVRALVGSDDKHRPWFQEKCECGWIFRDRHEVEAGCPACAAGVRVDADCEMCGVAAGDPCDCFDPQDGGETT